MDDLPVKDLPVIDLPASDAESRFVASMHGIGFAILRGHPLPSTAGIGAEWLAFFGTEAKHDHLHRDGSQGGYFPPPTAGERVAGGQPRDSKEFFQLRVGDPVPAGISPATAAYFAEAMRLAARLLGWLDRATPTRLPGAERFPEMITGSTGSTLRIQHYLPLDGDQPGRALRALEHQDLNLITLLPAPTSPGLQVRARTGEWLDVPWAEELLVVNVGRMLERASGGHYPATPHRVVLADPAYGTGSRLSFPLFVHPRPQADLGEGVNAADFLAQQVDELRQLGWAVAPGGAGNPAAATEADTLDAATGAGTLDATTGAGTLDATTGAGTAGQQNPTA